MSDVDEDYISPKMVREASPENITERNHQMTAAQLLPHQLKDKKIAESSIRFTTKGKLASGPGITLIETQQRSTKTKKFDQFNSPQGKVTKEFFFKTDVRQTTLFRNNQTIQSKPTFDVSPAIRGKARDSYIEPKSDHVFADQDMSCADNIEIDQPTSKP